jgi:hypothetical protein
MPTTTNLAIDVPLLNSVQKLYGFKTKKETVNTSLREMQRRKAVEELISLMGTIDIDPDFHSHYKKHEIAKLNQQLDS